jgi:hypothetical protein
MIIFVTSVGTEETKERLVREVPNLRMVHVQLTSPDDCRQDPFPEEDAVWPCEPRVGDVFKMKTWVSDPGHKDGGYVTGYRSWIVRKRILGPSGRKALVMVGILALVCEPGER